MKSRKMKLSLTFTMVALLALVWFSTYGINKTMDQTISVDVYEDHDGSAIPSSITISGNLKRTLFSTSFVGIFAMEYAPLSCREGTEAKIEWHDGYQDISFFYAGDVSRLNVDMIEIDQKMDRMMVVLKDGTIIASPDYYIPTQIWKQDQG